MPLDPWAIDSSGGAPSYGGQEVRVGTLVPVMAGAGVALGARSGVRPSGTGTDLLVQAQTTPNMSVKVSPGTAVIQGATTATQGPYAYSLDVVTNLTIAASHATLDRTDVIAVRIRDASVDTSGARDGGLVVIQGTNGGGVPALPTDATYYPLANVAVVHAVTTIVAGNITDRRGYTAALGGVVPVASAALETGLGTVDGTGAYRTDIHANRYYHGGVGAYVSPGMSLIQRQVLGADTAIVTFSSIPADFTHLRLIIFGKSTVGLDAANVQLNADTTAAHYEWSTFVCGNAGTTSAAGSASDTVIRFWQSVSGATSLFGRATVDIAHYTDTSTVHKQVAALGVAVTVPTQVAGGTWIPTAAAVVNRIDVKLLNGSWKAGSVFTLYGVS